MSRTHTRNLSERERAIIDLASQGLTDKEICRKLAISMTTVRTYWTRVRDKLGASNRAQIIAEVIRAGETGTVVKSSEPESLSRLSLAHWIYWPEVDRVDLCAQAGKFFGGKASMSCSVSQLLDAIDLRDRHSFVALLRNPGTGTFAGSNLHRTRDGATAKTTVLGPCCDGDLGRGWVFATMEISDSLLMPADRALVI